MTRVQRVDVSDDAAFAELYGLYARAHARTFDGPYLAIEKRVNLTDDAYGTKAAVVARDVHGLAVAGGTAVMALQDNTAIAFVEVFVPPEHRRRGHGSAVLDALLDIGRQHGRTIALGEAVWAVDQQTDAGRAFAEARGFTLDIVDAVRELTLPADVPPLVLDPAYTLETWRGPCPQEWLDEYADLRRMLNAEAPSGDIGLENEHWDAARVRKDEADLARVGRIMQVSVARAPDGSLAGHTQLAFPGEGDEVYQWDTLVRPAHRGHGLGLALKIHAMQAAADLLEGRRRITTWNAASNTHMIAVNERLGFWQSAWAGEYVRTI
ncbi:GNAT family N-acetyltransferase [Aeromicrobium sp. SMF47]|uniref:GNAT family N-acetyltransferase n=1 Tax=Aeromicrobium TaxID=2040 RepID=UPI00129DDEBB|nr:MULTISPECIES: GNAT family N-acetyltransferase [Aeromicrobium]MRJ76279.1 GNAT family N-acetyltransferase [Aeromicrobium yanjiei]MRK00629.1 GNAT family N-acetyltransferase [Aeromicrobium sp. S22]